MIDSEHDASRCGEQHIIHQEYNNIAEEFKRELEICKTEQNNIRIELQALYVESKDSSDAVRDYISRIHLEECGNNDTHEMMITNLKERIAVLQMEKDSVIQLWQISMKAVDTLEQKLRSHPTDDRDVKFYEEQLKDIRQSYSEAIKALENKLFQTKENFAKQRSAWATSKETIDILKREKEEMAKKLQEFQQDTQQRDRNNQERIQSLMAELSAAKTETQRVNQLKSDLEKKLSESKRVTNSIMARNEEIKCKMVETLDLIESAVKEKDFVLQREAHTAEQNIKLEARLTSIAQEHATKMQAEIAKLRDTHEYNVKKYLVEIKDLKAELREKVTLLDRAQRESRLAEEELDRVRRNSEDLLEKSTAKISKLEEALKHADSKLEACNEMCEKQHNLELQQLREKIVGLEGELTVSNERLKQMEQQNTVDMRDRVKSDDERTKDIFDRYINLESQLIKATDDKKSLATELKSLQSAFDREIHKRDYERHTMENRIRELETNIQKTNYTMESKSGANISPIQVSLQHHADAINKHALDIRVENMDHNWQSLLSERLSKQQELFDKKMKEMAQHVTVHQKLSRRWREEAKSLTARFQTKSKELRGKISSLRNENAELHNLICKQQFSQYRTDVTRSYIQRSETR